MSRSEIVLSTKLDHGLRNMPRQEPEFQPLAVLKMEVTTMVTQEESARFAQLGPTSDAVAELAVLLDGSHDCSAGSRELAIQLVRELVDMGGWRLAVPLLQRIELRYGLKIDPRDVGTAAQLGLLPMQWPYGVDTDRQS